jgi:DNA-binding response OmpR family regulator
MVVDTREHVRILVVDDEPTIVDFLETGLSYEGYAVLAVADGRAALEAAQTFSPDVVVLDLMLPELDGLEVCRRLRATGDVGILMLTARGDVDDRVTGLETGADDYLTKPFKFKELLARVRAILRRRRIALPHVLQIGHLRLDRDTREASVGNVSVHLTPREWELLELLMLHPRQVLTRETILNRVWGYEYIGDTNVVEVHISALRDKLGDRDKACIQTVRGVGYTLRGAS